MVRYLTVYFVGYLSRALVPLMFPSSKGYVKGSIGRIYFYGPKSFVDQCLEGVNAILPMYDKSLQQLFSHGTISLCFYYEEKHYITYHTAGLYTIPSEVVAFQSHGICQHIVWRYFQSSETGVGLLAALKDTPARHKLGLIAARTKMKEWLESTGYSKAWIECYAYNDAPNAGGMPAQRGYDATT